MSSSSTGAFLIASGRLGDGSGSPKYPLVNPPEAWHGGELSSVRTDYAAGMEAAETVGV